MVQMPTDSEILTYLDSTRERYEMLSDAYEVADELKMHIEKVRDTVIQSTFYNVWTHDHYVGKFFVFAPSGLIIARTTNALWSMHEFQILDWEICTARSGTSLKEREVMSSSTLLFPRGVFLF